MYSFESRVRYSEVDVNQELTITGIINYFQDCSTFQSEDLNLGIDYLKGRCRAWWLSSWQIVIERYPRLGEEIVISTWPYDFKGIYGYRNFTIQDKQGNYLVKANSIWFFFDTEAGRPARISPEDVRGYGTGDEKKLDMEYAARKIPVPEAYQTAKEIHVMRHHIDTNHHVNNAQYVDMAREALPEDIRIRQLRVEYKNAAVLGDVMTPQVSRDENDWTVVLCGAEGQTCAVVWLQAGEQKEKEKIR